MLGLLVLALPRAAAAFWPFSSAQAQTAPEAGDPTSTAALLEAATNPDPNPTKGAGDLSVSSDSALMASSGPTGALPPPSADTGASTPADAAISTYTVKEGDSISAIAAHFGVSVNTILWANDLTVRSTIKPGETLVILPVTGVKYTVAKGDTLSTIAAKFHANAQEIATYNGLDADATVVVGSSLIIPGGEESGSAASGTTAKKSSTGTKSSSSVKTRSDLAAPSAGTGYFENPVPGAILTQGIHGKNGVDLGAPAGTPIHAAAAGTVIVSKGDGAWNGGYGSYVVVSHANGTQTLYAHMSRDIASVGERVSQGEVIGYVGETGEATGNHLHFEVRGAKNPFGYSCSVMSKCY